jgi:IclR family transcriptional regulator, KDG regulon repressor
VAYDDCESDDSVRCVAAPVHDRAGAMVAAMSISVPAARWTDERSAAWTTLVRQGAQALSARLGFRPRPFP